jgi:hypothetical protein
MKTNNPIFWAELTKDKVLNLPNSNENQPEDIEPETSVEDVLADDSDLAMATLIGVMTGGELPGNVGIRDGGGLVSIAEAENVDLQLESVGEDSENLEANVENTPKEEGRGKRFKFVNKRYSAFWRHNDGDDWRDDTIV